MDQHKKDIFNTFLETQLNTPQQQAVKHQNGSLLVIAGAGSGKTRVITARITDLIVNRNVHAAHIIALTFTNKAAHEMKERIAHFLGTKTILPFVGTFHGYCVKLLKQYRDIAPVPWETILDADDQQKIIKQILKKNNLQKRFTEKNIAYQISHIKNCSISPDTAVSRYNDPLFYDIYQSYEQEKRISKCLDFDDLLIHTLALFKQPSFKTIHQNQIRHILVDEYQDTNIVQHELLKSMSLFNNELTIDSLCAVGDEDQSIYSWRGATVANIRNFTHDFKNTTIIKIEQNYRSIQQILDVANHVIKQNKTHVPKKLWSTKCGDHRIHLVSFASEYQEAETIAHALKSVQTSPNKKLSDIAILYRLHAQSRAFEEALIKCSIPYRIIGGVQFYDRMEIKDLLAYLKLIVNPYDRISCARIINVPTRSLGQKFEELFFSTWDAQPLEHFKDIAYRLIQENHLTASKKEALSAFIRIFETITPDTLPSKALRHIIEHTHYISYLKNSYEKEEANERIANIDELINGCHHFESIDITNISTFLEHVTLMQDLSARTTDDDVITLMTLHAAKGLEFDTVIIAGLEEGLFPTSRSLHDQESIEEERRLFYVGITRAQERLLLSYARFRHLYGSVVDQQCSRFVHDIPSHTVPHHDFSIAGAQEKLRFFSQWLNNASFNTIQSTHLQHSESKSNKKYPTILNQSTSKQPDSMQWRINQPVKHATYGIGIIKKIEKKTEHIIIEVAFKSGVKKIASDFLTPV